MSDGISKTSSAAKVTQVNLNDVITSFQDFERAYRIATMEGVDTLEVTPEVFDYICTDKNSASLTWGKPGVRVFKAGTVDSILKEENMRAEDTYSAEIHSKRRAMGIND